MDYSTDIDSVYLPQNLPRPDNFGNYWLDGAIKPHCPVIFQRTQEKTKKDGTTYNRVMFWASLGGDIGIIWQGLEIKCFDTPQEALEALRELLLERSRINN